MFFISFTVTWYTVYGRTYNFFYQSSSDGHLDYFQSFSIPKNATIRKMSHFPGLFFFLNKFHT